MLNYLFKNLALIYCLTAAFSCLGQTPWVENNALWRFHFEACCTFDSPWSDMGEVRVTKTGNTVFQGILCDQLVTTLHHFEFSSGSWQFADTIIIDTNYTYKSVTGDSVMWWQNNSFRTLYDFSKEAGDSVLFHVSENSNCNNSNCEDSSYYKISNTGTISFGSNSYRKMAIQNLAHNGCYKMGDFQFYLNEGINERFGPIRELENMPEGFLFPVSITCSEHSHLTYKLLCFSDDSLSYDSDCDFFESLSLTEITAFRLSLFPNPTTEKLYFTTALEGQEYSIHQADGSVVLKGTIMGKSIDLMDVSSGL